MKKKTVIILCMIAGLVCLTVVGGIMLFQNLFGEFAGIKKQELQSYSCSTGGDMNGGHDSVSVHRYDDARALITYSSAEWYNQDASVREYLTDIQILEDIKTVFCKYNMQKWHQRSFTDLFIADGATTSYSFRFTEDSVNFSSQYYPQGYAGKLNKIDEIIETYVKNAELLPGLVLPELTDEELMEQLYPEDGLLHFTVYEYSESTLHFRLTNGSETDISVEGAIALYRDGTPIPLAEDEDSSFSVTVLAGSREEESICLQDLLPAGEYTLKIGAYEAPFSITYPE